MNKSTLMTALVAVLVLLNLCTLGYILVSRKGPPHPFGREMPPGDRNRSGKEANRLDKKLNFDVDQIADHKTLRDNHHAKIAPLNDQLGKEMKALYQLLKTDYSSLERDSLMNNITAITSTINYVNFGHFENIKELVNEDQKMEFNDMLTNLANEFYARGSR